MPGAVLTTIFFSLSVIMANRSIAAVGSRRANFGRLLTAVLVLGAYAHLAGGGLGGAGRDWFLLSGVIGMGLGDLALYGALPRLGSRLSLLMTQCLAAPIAALAEWLWLDSKLTTGQMLAGVTILAGVALALAPSAKSPPRVTVTKFGVLCGFLSAAGQGLGAVVSRKANFIATQVGESTDGITAAYQRILGGFVITVVWLAVASLIEKRPATHNSPSVPKPTLRDHVWIPLNAACGPIIGVSCYQWALATTPTGIVLPIVACTPIVIVPFSYWLEGERPTRRSLTGGIIAVIGVVALSQFK